MTSVMFHLDDKVKIDENVETSTSPYGRIRINVSDEWDSVTIFMTKAQAIEMAAKIMREVPELKERKPEEVKYPF